MDNMGDLDMKILINELTGGRELARQLQCHVNLKSSSAEYRDLLLEKILVSYEKVLLLLNSSNSVNSDQQPQLEDRGRMPESPPLSGSPRGEDSENGQEIKEASRKRKAVAKWTQQVRISPGTGLEGPLDDGFCWRKYGQKDILGAKYPRGYYRCTHRHVRGCSATKQVQRSDLDPTVFEVTYRGHHTCAQASQANNNASTENQEQQNIVMLEPQPPEQNHLQSSQDLRMNFQTGLKVITDDMHNQEHAYPLYNFSSTSSYPNNTENQIVVSSLMDSSLAGGSVSPVFLSPATSGTNYFSESSLRPNGFPGNSQNFQNSESELDEIISAATSGSNSSTFGFDFPLGQAVYEPNFTFGNSGFFP